MKTLLLACLAILPVPAATIVSGGSLLTQSGANQLASWLGQGDLSLTNIFSSAPVANGSTAFHTAVDGQGATFVLIQTDKGLVGGYNPLSWSTSSNYNTDPTDAGRTAFIFNLSNSLKLSQRLVAQGTTPDGDTGVYQTFNYAPYGPAFGGGHDLVVNTSNLQGGYLYSYSYGAARGGADLFGNSSVNSLDSFTVTRLEAYTFTTGAATPEPATMLLCGGGLLLLALRNRLK